MTDLWRGGGLALRQGAFTPTVGVEFVGGQDSADWIACFIYLLVHNAPLILNAESRKRRLPACSPVVVLNLTLYINYRKRQTVN
jgi:hypothetical protein